MGCNPHTHHSQSHLGRLVRSSCSPVGVIFHLGHAEPEVADGVNHLREVKITHRVRSYYIKDVKVGEVIIG